MTPTAPPKKPLSQQFIVSSEVSSMARGSIKTNEPRDTNSTGRRGKNTTTQNWETDNPKTKVVKSITYPGRNNTTRNWQMQVQKHGLGAKGTSPIKLELWRVHKTYYIVKQTL